ncbi:hypothetical protein AAHK20_28480 [Trinickia sp. YCB016]
MMLDISNNIRAVVLLGSPVIAMLVILYLLLAIPFIVFGSQAKRRKRLKRSTQVIATLIFLPLLVGLTANYVWFSEIRKTTHACETQASDDGKYLVTQCLLNASYLYLRVNDSETKKLLADRTYTCQPADSRLIVDNTIVFDGCEYNASKIELRPSLLDQLRAKLP